MYSIESVPVPKGQMRSWGSLFHTKFLWITVIGAGLLVFLPLQANFTSREGITFSHPRAKAGEKWRFHLEEATIADVHRAFRTKQLTATQLVNRYLKRIEAYNGTCVAGNVDAATGFQLGDITPIENAGKVNALMTLNVRGKRSKTDPNDNDPKMPDALEVAKALDAEFARTGKLRGPLHGIPFAIKDQFDTFDMRTTSGVLRVMLMTGHPKMRRSLQDSARQERSSSRKRTWVNTLLEIEARKAERPVIPTTPLVARVAQAGVQAQLSLRISSCARLGRRQGPRLAIPL